MIGNKDNTLWFEEVDLASLISYQVEVFKEGAKVGATQEIDKDDAVDGYDEVDGEMEIKLGTLNALTDAFGVYDFHIYSVNGNGRSEAPLIIEGIEIDFLLPSAPQLGGVR